MNIDIFDFDGTLFLTPRPIEGKRIWTQKTGKIWTWHNWWDRSESLDYTVFNIRPNPRLWKIAQESSQNHKIKTILLTGRCQKVRESVQNILNEWSLNFDKMYFNPICVDQMDIDHKLKTLRKLGQKYPEAHIRFWDDKPEYSQDFIKLGTSLFDKFEYYLMR